MNARRLLLVAAALVASLHVELTAGCSYIPGWTPPPDEKYVLWADWFLYGRVLSTVSGGFYDTYDAEVEVYCIMKGHGDGRTPAHVTIHDVGFIPGMCSGTELKVGQTYVILANGINQLRAFKTFEADENKLKEMIRTCGLHAQYPFNTESNVKCPQPAGPDDCLDLQYFDSIRPTPAAMPTWNDPEYAEIKEDMLHDHLLQYMESRRRLNNRKIHH